MERTALPEAYRICGFSLVTGGSRPAHWEIEGELVDAHMAITRVIGGVSLGDPIPCVGGPGPEVRVGTMSNLHRQRVAVLPIGEWVDLGGSVWCSHDGKRLSISVATELVTSQQRHTFS